MEKVLFNISPLTCENCASEMEIMLVNQNGIRSGKVFNNLGKVWCSYDETQIQPEKIEQLINNQVSQW